LKDFDTMEMGPPPPPPRNLEALAFHCWRYLYLNEIIPAVVGNSHLLQH